MEVITSRNEDDQDSPAAHQRGMQPLALSLERFQKREVKKHQSRRGDLITELTAGINRRQPFYIDQKTGKKKQLKPLNVRAVAILVGWLNEHQLQHLKDLCKETEQMARNGSKGYEGRTFAKEFFSRTRFDQRFMKPEGWVSNARKNKAKSPPAH